MEDLPFHPVVRDWFARRFAEPTEPQRLGWPEIAAGRDTLIAAPTGSGKTLAAFLVCIDRLLREALEGGLPDELRVVYVSPLKALSNDIRRNLEAPLAEIWEEAGRAGRLLPPLRAAVRTGDTPAAERAAILRRPPHILVTTPESLYLLLTAEKGRRVLATARTVIVDEIHALARDKRGSHLALTLERLEALCRPAAGRLQRVGLSATQKPIEELARFLVGTARVDAGGRAACRVVDAGHARRLDLAVELPASELGAVCSNEQWAEIDARLVELIAAHRSTLVFVNTRRMAERVAHRLREKLGEEAVASHHGSLSRELRLSAEERLKSGRLKAIVATASLELGIDIGYIDLVCQLGSPRSIATLLQRVGRAGHRLGALPKGRLFALTRDELLEALALLRAVRKGRLDAVEPPVAPIDILAQQLVAEAAARGEEGAAEDELFALCRAAWPFRALAREEFDRMLDLLAEGMGRGSRAGAYLHRDALSRRVRARRAARLTALTCGGAIPETADYRVVTEEEGAFVGTVFEEFAVESLAGDIFLLGNTSWRIRRIRAGEVVVADAQGAPATIPFWRGEAPGRTVELSAEVSELREELARRSGAEALAWLKEECGAEGPAAASAAAYVAAQVAAVGFVPTQRRILFERFFDESGGMQLVIHSPYGARINRAWGLALRKSFCRTFDFELQASADDDGIALSLGVQHSFPLEQMFTLLKSAKARDCLVQALLAVPMFSVRWRWNATRALAVPRSRGGKKVPPPIQRFRADDLLTAVFPLQTACFEHRPPDVPVPDHPLVRQTVEDCLREAMDLERWLALLRDIEAGRVVLEARDTREPSPFSHAILNANPYAFLDDAPLEERRARAVAARRTLSAEDLRDLARLDEDAIARVREEAWPVVRDPEELHDALLSLCALPAAEGARWEPYFRSLVAAGRAAELARADGAPLWAAAERWAPAAAAFGVAPALERLPAPLRELPDPEEAVLRVVRGRLEVAGPITASALAGLYGLPRAAVLGALARLEGEGPAIQGRFTGAAHATGAELEWCERRLLARIHRLTLEGARRRVRPVSPAAFWTFLAEYHHLLPGARRPGRLGLGEAVGQLQGFELPAAAWEGEVLPGRVEKYQPEWLDTLSFSGELAWGRLRAPREREQDEAVASLTRAAPVALAFRDELGWVLPPERLAGGRDLPAFASPRARAVHAELAKQGALFMDDLAELTKLPPSELREALRELAAFGAVSSDGFSALRGLFGRAEPARRSRWRVRPARAVGGRWTLFPGRAAAAEPERRLSAWAWQLARRYGVVFRDLLARENAAPSWWELTPVLRRMEARGELLGGRFVAEVSGEQYALPEAVEELRRPREDKTRWAIVSAADPLNLAGIVDGLGRVPALRGNRLLYRDGEVAAFSVAGEVRWMRDLPESARTAAERALRLQVPALRDALLAELPCDPAPSRLS